MKVLFLTVSAGGGHNKAAQNIINYIEANYDNVQCIIMDTLREINPLVDKVVIGSYLGTLKTSPKLYGKLFNITDHTNSFSDLSRQLNKILSIRLNKLIKNMDPDVIVCTHPFPLEMLSILKGKHKVTIPVIAIITDFGIHSYWIYPYIDKYIIAHESLSYDAQQKGVDAPKILPLGLPVSEMFSKPYNKEVYLETLGLKNKPTILIMGGSLGFGNIENVFEILLTSLTGYQIVAICGKNLKLYNNLKIYESQNSNVKIIGYTDRIALYMAASDILLTKPGGMTISEALNIGIPLALISPIPGQEERNARFLLNHGAAIALNADDNFTSTLKQLLDNPVRLKTMKEMAKSLSKPNAQAEISKCIYDSAMSYIESR